MLESLASRISDENDTSIEWEHTPDDIVEAVEKVFSAVKDRVESEQDLLEAIWDAIEDVAEYAEGLELPIKAAALAAFAPFAAIGAGYMGAMEQIKKDRSPIAFAEGVVMGVMAENRTDFIREKFWMDEPGDNPQFEYGGVVEQYYNNGALLTGLAYGKNLQGPLGQVFWADIKRANQQFPALAEGETDWNAWRDFYIAVAGAFVKLHIPEAYG